MQSKKKLPPRAGKSWLCALYGQIKRKVVHPMKKLLCLLFVLLLPALSAAEGLLLSEAQLDLGDDVLRIAGAVMLPEGQIAINYHINAGANWVEALAAFDGQGSLLWNHELYAYEADMYPKERVLTVRGEEIECVLFDQIAADDRLHRQETRLSLTGEVLGVEDSGMVPLAEKATVYHCGNFLVERYFGDYSDPETQVAITHLPTGNVRQYEMIIGTGNFHAFGDRLMYVRHGSEEGEGLWLFDEKGDMLAENGPLPFEGRVSAAPFSAQDEQCLYLFAWDNGGQGARESFYTVYPVDADMNIQEPLCSFTLGSVEPREDVFMADLAKSLSQPVRCGEGFLLLAMHPWVWQEPLAYDLCYLSMDGTLTVLETIVQADNDQVLLLPGEAAGTARLILRSGDGYVQRIYGE